MPYVFDFDHSHRKPPMDMKDLLGGKGANLAEMTSVLGLPGAPRASPSRPTPAGPTWPGAGPRPSSAEVARARARLEKAMGKVIGDPVDPLLVSVRSGAKFSMPGMMDTVLNLGLNDESVEGLAKQTGDERFAYDSYRRFVAMYGRIVLDIPGEEFDGLFDAAKELAGTTSDAKVPDRAPALPGRLVLPDRRALHRPALPPGPRRPAPRGHRGRLPQLERAPGHRLPRPGAHPPRPGHGGQRPGHGVRQPRRPLGTGVGFTRDPATGDQGAYGDFLVNAQGEDVVAGIRNTEPLSALKEAVPQGPHGSCWTSSTGSSATTGTCATPSSPSSRASSGCSRPGWASAPARAALKMAVDMTAEPRSASPRPRPSRRITEDHLASVLHPQFSGSRPHRCWPRASGPRPGPRSGRVYFTADDAAAAAERGETVVLVRSETSPEDVHGMLAAEGILTARGGLVSHAAVVARGWGKPAVVGAEALRIGGHTVTVGDVTVAEGDWVSIDGTSGHGGGRAGAADRGRRRRPSSRWCWRGPTRSGPATSACGPTPTPARTPPTPAAWGPRASGCAGPSTCSWVRTGCRWCAG